MAQTFNTILSFVKSTSRKDRRKGVGSLSVSAVAGGGVGSAADSATQAWVRDNFVDKTTEQEISALKIFSQGIKIGDVSLFKHPDGYVYLDETLVLKGGVVMYGNGSGAEVPSIFDSLPIDGVTIKRDGNGALYVDETALKINGGGGVGGGGISEEFLNVTLQGYQPKITSSNKLAYSLISGTPDLSVYFLASNFTKTNIKSTLGISDWALASAKPTYTASEVGALGVKDTAQQSYGLRHSTTPISDKGVHWWSGQFQVSTEPVRGKIYVGSSGDYTVISVPWIDGTSSLANACVLRLGYNRQFFHEIFTSPNSNDIYHRNVHIGNGNPWRKFAFTSDIPTNLSQLTDDVVAGKYLPITGGTINGSLTATSFIGNLTGNADSATKLATPRTIWGQSFDGTGNISGDIKSDNIIPTSSGSYTLGTADNQWYAIYSIRLHSKAGSDLYIGANNDNNIVIKKNGNVAIGDTTADATLHVHGTAKFTGDTTFSSKVVIGTIPVYQSADGTLFVDANVVFRGGVAMFGNTTTTVNEE